MGSDYCLSVFLGDYFCFEITWHRYSQIPRRRWTLRNLRGRFRSTISKSLFATRPSHEMHGISHLLSHHHGSDNSGSDTRSSISSVSSDIRNHDTRFLQELLSQKHDSKLYFHERHVSRGSVSSAYSYPSSSYGSSYGSGSGSSSSNHHQPLYNTIHGNSHYPSHHQYHHHQQHHHRATSSGKASPSSPSPTNEHEKQHHHYHSIHEMIRHFGRRLGHIRRQSECHESPKKREEDFRNRSQSLDGGARHSANLREADCETTYRIYESILRQGNSRERTWDVSWSPDECIIVSVLLNSQWNASFFLFDNTCTCMSTINSNHFTSYITMHISARLI